MGVFDWVGGDTWDWGSGISGTDFGSGWTDYTSGDGLDWSSMFGGGDGGVDLGSGGDSSSSWVKGLTSIFGGGGGSGSNIFGSLLSGLAGGASAALSGKDLKEGIQLKGKEDRKSLDFEAALKDYYTQEDKRRKRVALDTYGQFSMMDRIKKNYQDTPPVQVPTKPGVS